MIAVNSRFAPFGRLTTVTEGERFQRPWGVRMNNRRTTRLRNVGRARPQRERQDDAGRRPASSERGWWRGRDGSKDGTTVCDTEAEELKADDVAVGSPSAPSSGRPPDARPTSVTYSTPPARDFAVTSMPPSPSRPGRVVISAVDVSRSAPSRVGPLRSRRHPCGWCSSTRRTSSRATSIGRSTSCGPCFGSGFVPPSCRSVRRRVCTASPTCSPGPGLRVRAERPHHSEPLPATRAMTSTACTTSYARRSSPATKRARALPLGEVQTAAE